MKWLLQRQWLVTLFLAGAILWAPAAWAKANGIATGGCIGCHKGPAPTVKITVEPPIPEPGASAVVSVHVSRTNGNNAGFYLTSNKKGAFTVMGGPVRLVSPTEAMHSAPLTATTGDVIFQLRWTAPATKGGVDFEAWGVSGNGNNGAGGDGGGDTRLSTTYGCEGVSAFFDNDKDGFGRPWDGTRLCELTENYSPKGGDCDDNNKNTYPEAQEICDFYDNDCDGMINEELPVVLVYRDLDRDGHGDRRTEDTMMKCATWPGYSSMNDDCNDQDKDVHPGAPEMCNNADDNCNGRIDDGARASCGLGWCRRNASSCDPKDCRPGPPRVEMCNAFDDDCDGVIDNGANLCPEGKTCYGGYCLTRDEVADAAAAMEPVPEPGPRADGGIAGLGPDDDEPRHRAPPGACAMGGATVLPWGLMAGLLALLSFRRRR